jgi:hypothetical protein
MLTGSCRSSQRTARSHGARTGAGRAGARKAAVRKVLGDRFRVITDMRWDHVDSFIADNRAVTAWMVAGTGADGEKLNYRGCDLYEFRGDKVLNIW